MDAARPARTAPPPPAAGIRRRAGIPAEPGASLASLRGPAAAAQPSSRSDYHADAAATMPSRRYADEQQRSVALRRCAVRPDRIRRAGISARSGLSGRSLRLSERLRGRARAEEALERADDGCRRAGAGRGRDGRLPLPIAPMSVRPAAASRRSSRPTTARPRSCRRQSDAGAAKTPDRMLPAMAAKSSCRARRRRSTSIPGPALRAWCFRR